MASRFARKFSSSYLPSSSNRNVITGIIGINTAIFGAWKYAEYEAGNYNFSYVSFMNKHLMLSPFSGMHTMITNTFSHRDLWHLLSNMVTLYFISPGALYNLGAKRFIRLYLGAGIFGNICHIYWPVLASKLNIRSRNYAMACGASASVVAVASYSIFLNPTGMIYLYLVVPIPAALFLFGYVAYESYQLLNVGYDSNSGHAAHLGGFVAGCGYFAWRKLRRRIFRR